jgi:hypothetical protein
MSESYHLFFKHVVYLYWYVKYNPWYSKCQPQIITESESIASLFPSAERHRKVLILNHWKMVSYLNPNFICKFEPKADISPKFMLLKYKCYDQYQYLFFIFLLFSSLKVVILLLVFLFPSVTRPVITCWILVMCGLFL